MTALLGLLAVAGYQNRDKIAEMLRGVGGGSAPAGGGLPGALGGLFGSGLSGILGGAGAGGLLGSGLSELVDRFKQSGHGDVADSWVGTGPNKDITPDKLETALGPEVIQTLAEKTGLSRADLLQRLSRELPSAVDKYTPDGHLPT